MSDIRQEATITVPVDPSNPGEFLACCGLLELAHSFWGVKAVGRFGDNTFDLHIPTSDEAINFKDISIQTDDEKDAIHPIDLFIKGRTIHLDWWLNLPNSSKENSPLKTWAGTQKIYKNLLQPIFEKALEKGDDIVECFQYTANLSKRLGADTRSSWNKIDAGFSPDCQNMKIPIFVMVEFLSAVGLQRFRPDKVSVKKEKGKNVMWCYFLWKDHYLPAPLACVAKKILPEQCVQGFEFSVQRNGNYKYFSQAIKI